MTPGSTDRQITHPQHPGLPARHGLRDAHGGSTRSRGWFGRGPRRSRSLNAARPVVEGMEDRQLLAQTVVLDPVSHVLTITGSGLNDSVRVDYGTAATVSSGPTVAALDPSLVQVSLKCSIGGEINASFKTASIAAIKYVGLGGDDLFVNSTTLPATWSTTTTGTVSTSLLTGSPNSAESSQLDKLGVFTVGGTGQVTIDYLFDGAGYRGQVAIFSLSGMDLTTQGTAKFNAEAARRALSDSTLGHVVISVKTETAKYQATLPWEGNFHGGHGVYLGPKAFAMTPGDTFGIMLVPNGLVSEVLANPSVTGDRLPLYSLPQANPYKVTPQLRGQLGDLDGHGSLLAFEDLSLTGSSDRDYNDVVFQVTGARGVVAPVSEMVNATRNMQTTDVFTTQIAPYAAGREASDSTQVGPYRSGTFTVGPDGKVAIDFLYDGGGYTSEVAIFSLQGMQNLKPGSPEFIREAARRALSETTLGHLIISDSNDAARTSATLSWEPDYNRGTYRGLRTLSMTPGDTFGVMIVPAATVWEVYSNPTLAGKKTPLFSMPEANPQGYDQFAQIAATDFGLEDQRRDVAGNSDRDYNDIVFRVVGATAKAPEFASIVNAYRNLLTTDAASRILA